VRIVRITERTSDGVNVVFESHVGDVLEALGDKKAKALEMCGLTAEGFAKRLAPVDTGRLRNSIAHGADETSAQVGSNVEYAPYVELGTSRMKAQPFLKPAVADNGDTYKGIIESVMQE